MSERINGVSGGRVQRDRCSFTPFTRNFPIKQVSDKLTQGDPTKRVSNLETDVKTTNYNEFLINYLFTIITSTVFINI